MLWLYQRFSRLFFFKKLKKTLAISGKFGRLSSWGEKGEKKKKPKHFVPKQPCKASH